MRAYNLNWHLAPNNLMIGSPQTVPLLNKKLGKHFLVNFDVINYLITCF